MRNLQETIDNLHATLRGIAKMDPATEGARMQLWATDALSGFTEPLEATLLSLSDERNQLLKKTAGAIGSAAEGESNGCV